MNKVKKISQNDTRIEIIGKKTREEIIEKLTEVDCLIVPSLCYENSPTVIYEAKHFDLPIIASDLGGIPELLTTNDFLFEPKNEDDLINKINTFIKTQ